METLLYFNRTNLNGRYYTKDWFNETVLGKTTTNLDWLNSRSEIGLYGELNHPDVTDISLANVSHTISNIHIAGDELKGEVKILNTHKGKLLKSIIKVEGKDSIVYRPRSIGTTDVNGRTEIDKIFTFDAIPAADDSFIEIVKGIKYSASKKCRNN